MILLYGTPSLGHGTILFIFDGVIGGVVGIRVAPRISGERGALTALFATALFAVAAYMLYRQRFAGNRAHALAAAPGRQPAHRSQAPAPAGLRRKGAVNRLMTPLTIRISGDSGGYRKAILRM